MADNVQEWPSDGLSHVDNGMDFWHEVFIGGGTPQELPEETGEQRRTQNKGKNRHSTEMRG